MEGSSGGGKKLTKMKGFFIIAYKFKNIWVRTLLQNVGVVH
jgi:hypothetical protein